jgi:hypothetical protein
MVLAGFLGADTTPQLISAVMFYPLAMYFTLLILPKRNRAIVIPKAQPSKPVKVVNEERIEKLEKVDDSKLDKERRAFLKAIGTAGMTIFMLSIFTKKAQAAFFGSMPGPGTVALKDIAGNKINPAEKHPTDGYRIAELDDGTPSYYGFINKDGAWFIMRDNNGTYKYITGSSGFSSAWSGKGDEPEINWQYYDTAF